MWVLLMNRIKEKSVKASFGGIVTALAIIIMALGGVFSSLTYAAPAVCGVFLMVAVVEFGAKFAAVVYFAISFLSIAVVPNKECAVMFALFFGIYPIIKGKIEGKTKGVISWIIKYLFFNVAIIIAYLICSKLLEIPYEEIGVLGKYSLLFLWGSGNVTFFIYDIALTRLISAYIFKWQKFVKRLFR